MSRISNKTADLLAQGYDFKYCFRVELSNGDVLSFASCASEITIENQVFKSSSSLVIENISCNDSAEDEAIIKFIYSEDGISKDLNLLGAKVEILFCFPEQQVLELYLTMYVAKITADSDLAYMHLKSISDKLHQSMLSLYSKKCRANLGDSKCGINKELFTLRCKVNAIEQHTLELADEIPGDCHIYIGGKAVMEIAGHKQAIYNIVTITSASVTVDNLKEEAIQAIKGACEVSVKLQAICDKKLATCCERYDNALNFRGEPFIPGYEQFKL